MQSISIRSFSPALAISTTATHSITSIPISAPIRPRILLIDEETEDPATWRWTAADKLLLDLIRRAHAVEIRVVLDGVFNHTGRDFFAFADIRRHQAMSRYKDWYLVQEFDDPKTAK